MEFNINRVAEDYSEDSKWYHILVNLSYFYKPKCYIINESIKLCLKLLKLSNYQNCQNIGQIFNFSKIELINWIEIEFLPLFNGSKKVMTKTLTWLQNIHGVPHIFMIRIAEYFYSKFRFVLFLLFIFEKDRTKKAV